MEQIYQMNGYKLHILPVNKFKDIIMKVYFKGNASFKTNQLRQFLSFMMISETKSLHTNREISQYLENLYGATLSTRTSIVGNAHILSFRLSCINPQFLPKHVNVVQDLVHLLKDVLDTPVLSDKNMKMKKEELRIRIISQNDDKINYAYNQLYQYMGKDTPLAYTTLGNINTIDTIKKEDLLNTYHKMISEDVVDIYLVGNIDETIIENFKTLSIDTLSHSVPVVYPYENTKPALLEMIEHQDLTQTKLNIGFHIDTDFLSDDHPAMRLMNYMLGGHSQSRLFLNIREKRSLAYYINSSYDSFCHVLVITAGIHNDDYEKVKELVLNEVEELQQGKFTDEELEYSRSLMLASLERLDDNPDTLIHLSYNYEMTEKDETIEEYKEKLKNVTRDDIIRCANQCTLDTIYCLTGRDMYD